jgi:hypothetical protein
LFGWRQPAKGKLIKIDPDGTPTFNLSRQSDNSNRELDHASLVRRRTPCPDVAGDEDVFVRQRPLHHQRQLPTTVVLRGWAFSPRSKISRGRYRSVIRASGCETIVMNQTALKNSDQNVSQ